MVRMDGFDMDMEFLRSALGEEEDAEESVTMAEDKGVVFFEMLAICGVPVGLKLLGRHEPVSGDKRVEFLWIEAADGVGLPFRWEFCFDPAHRFAASGF